MKLAGQTAVVTGASRGIGKAIALALARAGANVAVNYKEAQAAAEAVAAEIRDMGRLAVAVRADVARLDDVRALAQAAETALGPVEILVNNAGILRDNYVTFMKDEEWNRVLDTCLKGSFHAIKAMGREMVRRQRGRIVNIASDAGLMGDLMRANYVSAKAGLIGLTKAVAREFAATGVTVNAVAPGVIATDMTADMNEGKKSRQLERIPQKRFGTPEDVAALVVFLASEEAAYITGQVIGVDGGLNM